MGRTARFLSLLLALSACLFSFGVRAATYTYENNAYGGPIISSSLRCADIAQLIEQRFLNLQLIKQTTQSSQFVAVGCSGEFTGTVGQGITTTFRTVDVVSWVPYGSTVSSTTYLTAVDGVISDERPDSQLLIAVMCCLGFGLGVVAGQQR